MKQVAVLGWLLIPFLIASTPNHLDSDGDGYPNVVEIRSAADRLAFLEWFAAVAEAQYTAVSPAWEYQDCSGLLRFAFVEALKPKDSGWFEAFPYFAHPKVQPVQSLSYPLPLLSRSVFRIASGAFDKKDVEVGRLVGLATAYELMRYASVPLGLTVDKARRGDLLFFAHPLAQGSG